VQIELLGAIASSLPKAFDPCNSRSPVFFILTLAMKPILWKKTAAVLL